MRYITLLSACVFLASAATHLGTFIGFSPAPLHRSRPLAEVHPVWLLHALVAFVTIAALLAAFRGKPGFEIPRSLPRHFGLIWLTVVVYMVISVIAHVAAGETAWGIPPHARMARMFSGFWMIFSGLAFLISYAWQIAPDHQATGDPTGAGDDRSEPDSWGHNGAQRGRRG